MFVLRCKKNARNTPIFGRENESKFRRDAWEYVAKPQDAKAFPTLEAAKEEHRYAGEDFEIVAVTWGLRWCEPGGRGKFYRGHGDCARLKRREAERFDSPEEARKSVKSVLLFEFPVLGINVGYKVVRFIRVVRP